MDKPESNVTVLDNDSRFLDYTHPAVARKLLKDGVAVVWSRSPFTIKLTRTVSEPTYQRRAQVAINWIEYFKEEKDIYCQNVSDMQVSIIFEIGMNRGETYRWDPMSQPVCLTQYIPFDSVKKNIDFRKFVTRRPPIFVLLTEEEFKTYYRRQAESEGLYTKDEKGKKIPDIDAAVAKAEADQKAVREGKANDQRAPLTQPPEEEDATKAPAPKIVTEDEIINPRVLHLCNQVKNEIPENERMPANDMLRELKTVRAGLKMDDWEYVRSHCSYPSIKRLCKEEMAELEKRASV
jgi:hypothetical protein